MGPEHSIRFGDLHMTEDDSSASAAAEAELEELKRKVRAQVEDYCRVSGYRLNPDRQTVERVITGLARRLQRYGQPYCPCRVMTGDPEQDKAIICPCIYHREEIARGGTCLCLLFCSPEYEAGHRKD